MSPRFPALVFLLASGVGATVIHMPILAALWETSYGKTILVKIGLLAAAMLLGAVNLLRSKPRLVAARDADAGRPAAALLRRTISGETLLLTAAVFAAALLSSLAPPAAALAKEGSALAKVGPGPVGTVVHRGPYTLRVLVHPNKAVVPNSFALALTKNGKPVRRADVTLTLSMLDMQMANQELQLTETRPGIYARPAPALRAQPYRATRLRSVHWRPTASGRAHPPGGSGPSSACQSTSSR